MGGRTLSATVPSASVQLKRTQQHAASEDRPHCDVGEAWKMAKMNTTHADQPCVLRVENTSVPR
ncbi:hypothetical protein L798_12763 [Zootermopsis nevadensis]|uniref:Uncharacterized protein n=1 Tax=Zootermopsis nevadensis TaxID=136037 RepID=A0A067RFM2_ZOONE|nr:hypothetical protein L798_12763 [Zootermopsis nevadensis]